MSHPTSSTASAAAALNHPDPADADITLPSLHQHQQQNAAAAATHQHPQTSSSPSGAAVDATAVTAATAAAIAAVQQLDEQQRLHHHLQQQQQAAAAAAEAVVALPSAADYSAPPPYDENDYKLPLPLAQGKLPTYEEVEQEKAAANTHRLLAAHVIGLNHDADEMSRLPPLHRGGLIGYPGLGQGAAAGGPTSVHCPPGLRVIAIHPVTGVATTTTGGNSASHADGSGMGGSSATDPESLMVSDDALLGTDAMFLAAFLLTFLFNWMGFLLITCACHNIAARYGALSGFGLSLAKWTMIVKNSTALGSDENSWLWWLIMGFGFLICVRSAVQYVSIKRSWRRMTVASAERMLVYDN